MPRPARPFREEKKALWRSRDQRIITQDPEIAYQARMIVKNAMNKLMDYMDTDKCDIEMTMRIFDMICPYISDRVMQQSEEVGQLSESSSLDQALKRLPPGSLARLQQSLTKASSEPVEALREEGEG